MQFIICCIVFSYSQLVPLHSRKLGTWLTHSWQIRRSEDGDPHLTTILEAHHLTSSIHEHKAFNQLLVFLKKEQSAIEKTKTPRSMSETKQKRNKEVIEIMQGEENFRRISINNFKERRNDIVSMKQGHLEKKGLLDIKNVRVETKHSIQGFEYKVKEISQRLARRVINNKQENTKKN